MANTSINLVDLDFDLFKDNLKSFLKDQDAFKDYDFEGSNINVLLDVLSYNTYMNAFYLNMIGNEMFLDSAQLRESAISRAKELNYTPRSFKSAKAVVDITVQTDGSVATVTMPKGTTFSTRIGSNNFTFSTSENIVIGGATSTKIATSVDIYEGQYISDTFTVNSSNTQQRYVLSNPTIDIDSITVSVIENNGADVLTYKRATSLFDKQSNSQIYFVQGAENEKYEILFGDGVIGRKPKNNSVVVCEYRICKGELPNGAFKFKSDGSIGTFSNVAVSTVSSAFGGSISESVESIKFNAPRYFNAQERAVTAEDYKNLLKINFPEINAVSVYGGEEADPPEYGKVYIAVDLKNVDGVPTIKKQQYYDFIKPRASLSIDPVFIDPDFMYLTVESTVKYNINVTALNSESIKQLILNSIINYNTQNLDNFNIKFRYSNFIKTIDAADRSIISNDTTVLLMRKIVPLLNSTNNFTLDFEQELENNYADLETNHPSKYTSVLTSSNFFYKNILSVLEDDGLGTIRLMDASGANHIKIQDVGTINYATGKVQLVGLSVSRYIGDSIKLYVRTKTKDIISLAKTILTIKEDDIKLNIISERG